jgi:3,4-dihydroxy 2-butanone 4-phosphate synthase/GTP cyclohydrolase II
MEVIESLLSSLDDHRGRVRRPFVTLSYAQSIDGCISARAGEPLALSGSESLVLTHRLRAAHDSILVGIGTVLSDNPRLTVRLADGKNPQPVVLDSRLRLPLHVNLLNQNSRHPWIATREPPDEERFEALTKAGAHILALPSNVRGQVCLNSLVDRLGTLGIRSVMVEGGSRIITSFLRRRLADFIVVTLAPMLVGGMHAVSDLGESDPEHFLHIRNPRHTMLGDDLILWGRLR